jgi:hypothetical protein
MNQARNLKPTAGPVNAVAQDPALPAWPGHVGYGVRAGNESVKLKLWSRSWSVRGLRRNVVYGVQVVEIFYGIPDETPKS